MKPHKGTIENWKGRPVDISAWASRFPDDPPLLGYYICGTPVGHPDFVDWIRTSPVIKHEENEIETLNSRYTLGKEA